MTEPTNKPKAGDSTASTPAEQPATKTTPAADDGRTEFEVTKLAGPRVAGRRVEGKTIRLTTDEAFSELQSGTIVPVDGKLHEMFNRKEPATKA